MKNIALYILGAGGMAREVFEIYAACGRSRDVKGYIVEKRYSHVKKLSGIPIYDESILAAVNSPEIRLIGAIGSPLRKRWIDRLEAKGYIFDTVIHPSAVIGTSVHIAAGTIISAGVILTTDITIGKHSILNISATVSHDTKVGDFVTIGPGAHISGRVTVGDGVFMGVGAVCRQNISINAGVCIGAGAVLVTDAVRNMLYHGVPAKPIRTLSPRDWADLI